jgi:hypothetical protein
VPFCYASRRAAQKIKSLTQSSDRQEQFTVEGATYGVVNEDNDDNDDNDDYEDENSMVYLSFLPGTELFENGDMKAEDLLNARKFPFHIVHESFLSSEFRGHPSVQALHAKGVPYTHILFTWN